jgi:putative membrane protein
MNVEKLFSEEERKQISAAVERAEATTSGEIVPYVVARSDHYEIAEWRAAALLGLFSFSGCLAVRAFTSAWNVPNVPTIALLTLGAGILGFLAAHYIPMVTRLCTGSHIMERRVEQRAAEAFISEEVFKTDARTGILIFLSLLERRVLVVGDSGINARVRKEEWAGVVATIVKGITSGEPARGLTDGIDICGRLLSSDGVARSANDRDELSDNLRIGRS